MSRTFRKCPGRFREITENVQDVSSVYPVYKTCLCGLQACRGRRRRRRRDDEDEDGDDRSSAPQGLFEW